MNLLKNCIAIPERIHQGDFVLKLTEGIAQQQTLHDYVVTPELVKSVEHAMDFTGQCAEHVLKRHPEAPVPGFYLAEGLFRDAARLRE